MFRKMLCFFLNCYRCIIDKSSNFFRYFERNASIENRLRILCFVTKMIVNVIFDLSIKKSYLI